MKRVDIILQNEEGLHARPASIFSKKAGEFKSDIILFKDDDESKEYNPRSILSLMSMAAAVNSKITIVAEGEDEEEAVEELQALIESGFPKKEE